MLYHLLAWCSQSDTQFETPAPWVWDHTPLENFCHAEAISVIQSYFPWRESENPLGEHFLSWPLILWCLTLLTFLRNKQWYSHVESEQYSGWAILYPPFNSWKTLRLSTSLWTFSHPSHLASTVPAVQPLGLTLFTVVVLHMLHVNFTYNWLSRMNIIDFSCEVLQSSACPATAGSTNELRWLKCAFPCSVQSRAAWVLCSSLMTAPSLLLA